jgi:hypothetical protein
MGSTAPIGNLTGDVNSTGLNTTANRLVIATLTDPQILTNKTFGDLLTANAGAAVIGGMSVSGTNQQLRLLPSVNGGESSIRFNTQPDELGNYWYTGQGVATVGLNNFGIGNSTNGVAMMVVGTAITCPGSLTAGSLTTAGAVTSASVTASGTVSALLVSSTGKVNATSTLTFPYAVARKRVALFDGGDTNSQTDHRFYGFGTAASTLVYQVILPGDSHVFYSSTSPTTSNELFRIAGSGAISCAGNLTAGSLTTTGALTAPSITFPSGTLSYYEATTFSFPFTKASDITSNVNFNICRVGNMVTLSSTNVAGLATGTLNGPYVSNGAVPTRFTGTAIRVPCQVTNNGVAVIGMFVIDTVGGITIYAGPGNTSFTGTGASDWGPITTSWSL